MEAASSKKATAFDEANKATAHLIKPKTILYTSALLTWLQPFQSGWSTSQMNLSQYNDTDECNARPVAEDTCLMFPGHSKLEWTFAVNAWIFGAMVGSLCCGHFSDKYGRKTSLMGNCVFMIVGGVVQASVSNVWLFALGRLIAGISSGTATATIGSYVNELSPPHMRNTLGLGLQISTTIGILIPAILFFFANTSSGWRYLAAFPVVLAVIFLLLAPSISSEGEDPEEAEDRSALSADSTAPSETKDDDNQVSEDYEEKGAISTIQGDSYDGLSPSPPTERAKQKARTRTSQRSDSIDEMEMSVESLIVLAQQRGLAMTALSQWSVREDGKLLDPDLRKYRSLRDALRAYTHLCQGTIPREDIYYLAILRRVLAEQELPLVDGPISVMALGTVVPEDHFYTSKKLFPIGYETLVNVQLTTPTTVAFRLRCKIVHGNKKKSPIFVVELENSTAEIVFRSYVASKAWKKALVHFESLSSDELMSVVSESMISVQSDDSSNTTDVLTLSSGEDGFGLLRRNVTRILEGLHQVFLCKDYQFWEQRHPITPDVHAKIRSRLKDQVKDILKVQNALSKEEIKCQLSQDVLLEEHAHNPEELFRMRQQKEKDQREADKRSVREAARKLLEIEMKAQEDAKEAQRRAKEERKNALLEAKMQAARQKEARKEALRLAREEEKRVREEEKEVKRALREEEKRKKLEEKENSMKRRIEELRQRRQMREEQKAILENGVVTSFSPRRFGDSRKRKTSGGVPDAQSIKQQHLALLKFVEEEKERRRQIRVWEKKNEVERFIWTRVKTHGVESKFQVGEKDNHLVVTKPMDLGTISEKIEDEDYENDDVESFVDDVALVWKNCYTYNSLKAEISNLAQKLAVVFDRLMKEWVYTTDNRALIAGEEDNCRNCQTIHFRKKVRDMTANSSDTPGNNEVNEGDLTDLEKRIQSVIDLLSQDNYTKLTVSDRLKVLRVLCELLEETAAVQSVYHSLEEKASDVRRSLGDSLADLEREWDRFCPPRTSHGVEQTKKFIIDGVEHELTDELLTYLEEKANAELEAKPALTSPLYLFNLIDLRKTSRLDTGNCQGRYFLVTCF
ncbi:hypothetical protein BBI17_001728 [Phytophthora kernoviae]|uniref:Bromo domain-containing protein n=1 Tax=Phytophthora kernoviae TaxID=325452 RepID=A0A3R7FWP1_9STRA|nr:hypothetical protein BBI17_001728 [Phytophthora kernoviae]